MCETHHERLAAGHMREARAETVRRVLDVLERGTQIGGAMDGVSSAQYLSMRDRLCGIRDDLIELDLYRLHYGPLPVDEPPALGVWRGAAGTVIATGTWQEGRWVTTWSGGPT